MASARQRDGRWTGLYCDHQGRQRSADTYDTKTAALKHARTAEALEASGQDARPAQTEMLPASSRRGKITVAGYAPTWLAGWSRPPARPTRACSSTLSASWATSRWPASTRRKVRSFIRGLEATRLSASTIGLVMTTLRMLCETAVADQLLDRNPCAGVKIAGQHQAEMRILTPAEYRDVLTGLRPSPTSHVPWLG